MDRSSVKRNDKSERADRFGDIRSWNDQDDDRGRRRFDRQEFFRRFWRDFVEVALPKRSVVSRRQYDQIVRIAAEPETTSSPPERSDSTGQWVRIVPGGNASARDPIRSNMPPLKARNCEYLASRALPFDRVFAATFSGRRRFRQRSMLALHFQNA